MESLVQAKYYTPGREGHSIKYIVLHHWGDDDQSHDGVVDWFHRGGAESSAHYVVSAGRVTPCVREEDTAWHAGDWEYNIQSIGIECRPEMSEGDQETAAELVREIRSRYGDIPIIEHRDIVPTACPGRWHASALDKLARGKAVEPEELKKDIHVIAKEVIRGDWGVGEERKRRLKEAGYNPAAVQDAVNARLGWVSSVTTSSKKSIEEIAEEVISGSWGNGEDRKSRLRAAGYDPSSVQEKVNDILLGSSFHVSYSLDAVAKEVIRGDWGNGEDRKNRLRSAGFDPDAVQERVNQLLL